MNEEVTVYHIDIGLDVSWKGCEGALEHIEGVTPLVGWTCQPSLSGMSWIEFGAPFFTHDDDLVETLMQAMDMDFPGMLWITTIQCRSPTFQRSRFLDQHEDGPEFGIRMIDSGVQTPILQEQISRKLVARNDPTIDGFNDANKSNGEEEAQMRYSPLVESNSFLTQLLKLGSTALENVLSFVLPIARDEEAVRTMDTENAFPAAPYRSREQSRHGLAEKRSQVLPHRAEIHDQLSHEERSVSMDIDQESVLSKAHTGSGSHTHEYPLHAHHHRQKRLRSKRTPPSNDNTDAASQSSASALDRQYTTSCNIVDLGDKVNAEIVIDEPFEYGHDSAAKRGIRGNKLVHDFNFERGDDNGKETVITLSTARQNLVEIDGRLSQAFPKSIFECAKHNRTNKSKSTNKELDKAALDARDTTMDMRRDLSKPEPPSYLRTEIELDCMSSPPSDPLPQYETSCDIEDYHRRANVDIVIRDPYQHGHCPEARRLVKETVPSLQQLYCAP